MIGSIPRNLPRDYDAVISTASARIQGLLARLRELRDDPAYSDPQTHSVRLRRLKRLVTDFDETEIYAIAALERVKAADNRMNRMLHAIKGEIAYPLIAPVVSPFSQCYFFIHCSLNMVFVPLLEGNFLLHLADLYHELGHGLQSATDDPKVAPLLEARAEIIFEADAYFRKELRKSATDGLPRSRLEFLAALRESWVVSWVDEFICDIYACVALGPAYAWSHLHLCAKRGGQPFLLPRRQASSHPADHVRMSVMLDALSGIGHGQACGQINNVWEQFLVSTGDRRDPTFDEAYPSALVNKMIDLTVTGLKSSGCDIAQPGCAGVVRAILNEAWDSFWKNPNLYPKTEEDLVKRLYAAV